MERALLETLNERGPSTVVGLASSTGLHPTTVEQRCYDFHRNGYVQTPTSGVYELTDTGKRHLLTLRE